MKKEVLAGVLGAAVAVSACNVEPEVRTGTVTDKQDIPAEDWIFMQPVPHQQCYYSGKSETCTTYFTYIPVPMHRDESWEITIENCDIDPKCKTATLEVDQKTYEQTQVGQHVDFSTPAPTK